ncbi:MAG: copper-translocating P-type ATPase [Calditrichaeota bacterium]|nr:MAG: copper-translocating P-type ATPase [Calditrichota bacterium]
MSEADNKQMDYLVLPIAGMTCASCVARVKQSIDGLDGVSSVDVSLAAEQAAIGFEGTPPDTAVIKKEIEKAGYALRSFRRDIRMEGFNDPTSGSRLQQKLETLPGVEKATFNAGNETMTIDYIPGLLKPEALTNLIEQETGVQVCWKEESAAEDAQLEQREQERIKRQFRTALLSIGSALLVFLLTMEHFFSFVQVIPKTIRFLVAGLFSYWVVFYSGRDIFRRFWYKLRPGKSDMNTLVGLGALVALLYSTVITIGLFIAPDTFEGHPVFFDSAAFIIGFILLGRSLEARARRQTGQALRSLSSLQPEQARITDENGEEKWLPTPELKAGMVCVVKNGERVPADGVLLNDHAELDEAMLSGESLPVTKSAGQLILSGTINSGSTIRFKVVQTGAETALGQIVRWVKQAQNSTPPVQKLVDKIAAVFVPVIIGLALITLAGWSFSGAPANLVIMHFINVIVIACPCALGLATPTAIVTAMGRSARSGMLIKSAAVLEALIKVDTILFDKTGTLTQGRLTVQKTALISARNEEELFTVAAMLEQHATHPIARAILATAREKGMIGQAPEKAQMLTGFGIKARVDEQTLGAGNIKLMQALKVPLNEKAEQAAREMADSGMTAVYISRGQDLLGIIGLADTPRPEAAEVVKKLHRQGIRTAMVTGDNTVTAQVIARQLGLDEVFAEHPPQMKSKVVKELQDKGHRVAMTGDGINDAVALTAADVGIALAEGTDVAIDAADIVLLRPDLRLLARVKGLAQKTERIIKENLLWAFGYNVVMIPIAAGLLYWLAGIWFNPAFAALAMAMSSVSVVTNSLRLRYMKIED